MCARAALVDRPRDELLAASRLTRDEHGRLGRGDLLDHPVDLLHHRRAAIKAAETAKRRCGRGTRSGHERQRDDDVVGRFSGQRFLEVH
jgi:hypothetical protein